MCMGVYVGVFVGVCVAAFMCVWLCSCKCERVWVCVFVYALLSKMFQFLVEFPDVKKY